MAAFAPVGTTRAQPAASHVGTGFSEAELLKGKVTTEKECASLTEWERIAAALLTDQRG
jgi:heme-degrading monooxygenase HmoA